MDLGPLVLLAPLLVVAFEVLDLGEPLASEPTPWGDFSLDLAISLEGGHLLDKSLAFHLEHILKLAFVNF